MHLALAKNGKHDTMTNPNIQISTLKAHGSKAPAKYLETSMRRLTVQVLACFSASTIILDCMSAMMETFRLFPNAN